MRLADLVVQSPPTMRMAGRTRTLELPGAGTIATAVADCGLRYILDRAASRRCSEVMFERGGLLAHPDELSPLPERPFWLECYADGDEIPRGRISTGRKVGFLVEPEAGGRSGTISCVAEAADGEACLVAGTLHFDLEGRPRDLQGYRIRHQDSRDIDGLLDRARLRLTEAWAAHAADIGMARPAFVKMQADMCWYALPIIVTFTALMNARGALGTKRSDLARLNASRAKVGRPPLMEHIEVSVDLSPLAPGRAPVAGDAEADRRSPRLHFVRGHTVHRAGGSFWRSSHFRGEGGSPVKTVSVTSARHTIARPLAAPTP